VGILRVGLDGRVFSSPAAGVRRYVNALVPALRALNAPLDLVLLGGSARDVPAGFERVAEPRHPPTNLGWTLVGLPIAARRARVQLLHAPAYTAPVGIRTPVVVTIHDVSYERHPEWYPYRRDRLRRAFYRASARSAARVVTDSAFSASEIHAAYGIALDRIAVVPLGVVPRFAEGEPAASDVPSPFVLHVGDLHPRRNLGVVLEAVLTLRRRGGATASLTLVLAGIDRGLVRQLQAQALSAGAPEALTELGVVSDARLDALYRDAAALVYPSLYEGFGLPVLEAMARGTPVVAARASSVPEVLGDAGVLLDPGDAVGWAASLDAIIGQPDRRAALATAGQARAATFTWERTARETYEAYLRAIAAR
jgi:glycosyltransferase involved in cell wall biosynthesis